MHWEIQRWRLPAVLASRLASTGTQTSGPGATECVRFSALRCPLATRKLDVADWAVFAQVVLEGAYEATLAAAAVLASERRARVKVFLTAVGGGAFRNQTKWITAAIRRALRVHAKSPLDVRLVHHGCVKTGLKELEPIQRSLMTSCFDWSCLWAWRTPSI